MHKEDETGKRLQSEGCGMWTARRQQQVAASQTPRCSTAWIRNSQTGLECLDTEVEEKNIFKKLILVPKCPNKN